MSAELKHTIDRFGPLALAGYVGYRTYKSDPENYQKLAIITLVAFIAARIFIPMLSKEIVGTISKPADIGGTITTPGVGGGTTSTVSVIDSRIQDITNRLNEDIYCVFCIRDTALYAEVAALSAGDLAAVYNDWQSRYYYKDKEDLIRAMEGEIYLGGTKKNAESIISRIKAMI